MPNRVKEILIKSERNIYNACLGSIRYLNSNVKSCKWLTVKFYTKVFISIMSIISQSSNFEDYLVTNY